MSLLASVQVPSIQHMKIKLPIVHECLLQMKQLYQIIFQGNLLQNDYKNTNPQNKVMSKAMDVL